MPTPAADRFYFGRASFRVAAEAIALYGATICERIALYQVKRLAFRASPANASQIAFWAAVLAQSTTLQLGEGEAAHLCVTAEFAEELAWLERRSRPQVISKKP